MLRKTPKVVLVADRTLSADYKILFEGIFATMQTTKVPELVMRRFVAPAVRTDAEGRAQTAPLGLRRVEAALVQYCGLGADEVMVTTPERLVGVLGDETELVCFSSSDPLGHGMSNTTTTSFWSGELYTKYFSRAILTTLLEAKSRYGFKVLGGGAGAWQWRQYPDATAQACLDHFYEGYFEDSGPELVNAILGGGACDAHVQAGGTASERVCPIRGGSLLGIIELSRGCGRGCHFCTMARKRMEHLSHDLICSDLETNVANGIRSVVSGSEDFFRYGAQGLRPEFETLRALLVAMKEVKGLSFMQIDHANVTSLAQMTDEQLAEVRRLLTWEQKSAYLWVNMGVESASGHLAAANCPGKVAPYRAEDWEGLLYETAERMTRNGYFGVYSLVLGLPGETAEDIARTRKFVRFLEKQNAVVFPVFFEPYDPAQIEAGAGFSTGKMREDHLDLYSACYEINFKKVPLLFWDNQRCGGVPWVKRALMRTLGKTEIFQWRGAFGRVRKEIQQRQKI